MKSSVLASTQFHKNHGFSLIEMAVVLMIMGVLMSGVLISISQTTLSARRASALAQLRQVEEALYGFAESQGRLPCPASIAALPTNKGFEDGSAGNCNYTHGFLPSATLGINGPTNDDGLLLDPWGNPLRYSLQKTIGGSNPDFSDPVSIKSFFKGGTALAPTPGITFQVCDTSDCSGSILANTAPAVIMTMGENWASSTSPNEVTNAGTNSLGGHPVHAGADLIFVSAGYSEDNFDDQLVWLSPYVLFSRMVSAGKLP